MGKRAQSRLKEEKYNIQRNKGKHVRLVNLLNQFHFSNKEITYDASERLKTECYDTVNKFIDGH